MPSQEYVSLYTDKDHIERHFSGSLTAGSKFYPNAKDIVMGVVEQELIKKFNSAQESKIPAGRTVLVLNFDIPVGTDALVALNAIPEGSQHKLIRDVGTPNEAIFTAVEALKGDILETSTVTVIAGPYGPTGKWGIYTMFPGKEAPPFPSENQPEAIRQSNQDFWNNHGFLATQEEILASPRADGEPHAFSGHELSMSGKHPADILEAARTELESFIGLWNVDPSDEERVIKNAIPLLNQLAQEDPLATIDLAQKSISTIDRENRSRDNCREDYELEDDPEYSEDVSNLLYPHQGAVLKKELLGVIVKCIPTLASNGHLSEALEGASFVSSHAEDESDLKKWSLERLDELENPTRKGSSTGGIPGANYQPSL